MIVCKASMRNQCRSLYLKISEYVIEQYFKVQINILASLSNISTVNSMISKINHRLILLKEVIRYTNKRKSEMLMISIIISVIKHLCLILINSNILLMNKLNSLLINCTGPIQGIDSYKWNTTTIMNKGQWTTLHHMIFIESFVCIHKCIFEGTFTIINKLITFSINCYLNIRSI